MLTNDAFFFGDRRQNGCRVRCRASTHARENHEQAGNQNEPEDGAYEHAAERGRADRAIAQRTRTRCDYQGNEARNEG